VFGIVLAAGSGERMGGPKARLVVRGEPLAKTHAARLREAGCDAVVMVVREEDVDVVPADAVVAVSSAPDPAGSLLAGLKLVPAGEGVLVVTPIDVLPARLETIRVLVGALEGDVVAATPTYDKRGGHPVVCRREVLDHLSSDGSLREVLAALGPRRVRVATDDPAVLAELDVPDDVIAHTGSPPAFTPRTTN
jgi:CTP:molybdopterin cytidylyltransferase MocA